MKFKGVRAGQKVRDGRLRYAAVPWSRGPRSRTEWDGATRGQMASSVVFYFLFAVFLFFSFLFLAQALFCCLGLISYILVVFLRLPGSAEILPMDRETGTFSCLHAGMAVSKGSSKGLPQYLSLFQTQAIAFPFHTSPSVPRAPAALTPHRVIGLR